MENLGLGAGLAALAFWGFVAVAVLATVWNGIRKRESQHETVRRLIESGQTVDDELLKQLSLISGDENRRPDREFYVTALWMLPTSVGVAVMGVSLAIALPDSRAVLLGALLGAAGLIASMGVGWLIAAKIVGRWYAENRD